MKNILFNELSVIYFVLILVTHFLKKIGRNVYVTKKKIGFLIPAVASAMVTMGFLAYYSLVTHWWMIICLFNLGILFVILVDGLLLGVVRTIINLPRLIRTFR